ncbi:MAG: DUF1801 domain-containing protein [Chthonomonadales bacterium]|nr:DUF1801 domain-containing protein [Chthonomonadales bacterium]
MDRATTARETDMHGSTPSQLIDARIEELGDWRGATLARVRALIRQADPEVVEEFKWRGVPVWSHGGLLCTGETYKDMVKMTFAKGASLEDPAGLFNASLEGSTRRAIDLREGDPIDEGALKALVRAAVALNTGPAPRRPAAGPRLLAGGNPQIARADGDAPVQSYIAAMPGWKSDVGRRLDALADTVPDVRKAVKWNSPFYGVEGQGWFLSFHCFARYVKVAFFRGSSLSPVPPGPSRDKDVRYLHVHEGEELDEAQLAAWIRQAAALRGWVP